MLWRCEETYITRQQCIWNLKFSILLSGYFYLMNQNDLFEWLKARYVIVVIIIAFFWQPGSQTLYILLTPYFQWYWYDLTLIFYAHGIMVSFLLLISAVTRLKIFYIAGKLSFFKNVPLIFTAFLVTYCASIALVFLEFYPLSYIFPNFVNWWLEWAYIPIIYLDSDGHFPIMANMLNFLSLVVFAPMTEEFIFRGYLLHRWTKKWGLWAAIVLSSVLFGALHPDSLGAAFTGFVFAILYLRTQSLWAAIIAHALYNLTTWLWEFLIVININDDYISKMSYLTYTVEQFQQDSWIGVIAVIVTLFLINKILRGNGLLGSIVLPQPQK